MRWRHPNGSRTKSGLPKDAIARMEQRQDEVVRLQKEMMDMVAKLSGRVTKLEREPPNMSTEASR